jgi:hypothetical protein
MTVAKLQQEKRTVACGPLASQGQGDEARRVSVDSHPSPQLSLDPRVLDPPAEQFGAHAAGRNVPILCTPGTRGYHLHPSHCGEAHDKAIWTLSRQASLLGRLMSQMGTYLGRGL